MQLLFVIVLACNPLKIALKQSVNPSNKMYSFTYVCLFVFDVSNFSFWFCFDFLQFCCTVGRQ